MQGSEVYEVKLTTLYVVSPVASVSLIGSDIHHFVFTVYILNYLVYFAISEDVGRKIPTVRQTCYTCPSHCVRLSFRVYC